MNTLAHFCGGVFQWILQTTWQAAVVVLLVLIVQMIFRHKLSPAWRYGLWLLVVARLLMPASPQSAISIFNLANCTPRQPIAAPPAQTAMGAPEVPLSDLQPQRSPRDGRAFHSPPALTEAHPAERPGDGRPAGAVPTMSARPNRPANWFGMACAVWLGGVCLLAFRLVWANVRFGSRLARHVPVADAAILRIVEDCADTIGFRHPVGVIETEEVESPAACGLWEKRVLLPDGVFERFSSEELRHIFLHELAHLKRRDVEVNWLAALLQILHWFNPVLWLAFARMRADRELAADALALAHVAGTENVPYGETILKVVENLARGAVPPGLVGIAESKAGLKARLGAIARRGAARPWRWAASVMAAILAGVGLTSARQTPPPEASNKPPAAAISTNSTAGANQAAQTANQRNFAIRVSDYETGTPLDGVAVSYTLEYFGGKSIQQASLSDKDGRAAIQFAPSDLKHLDYVAQKTNYLALKGEWFDQELSLLGEEYSIKLSRGVEIGGTVTEENGKPVAGAEVCIDQPMNLLLTAGRSRMDHAEMWNAPSGQRLAVTGADGAWKARCIWPAMPWASLRIHHPDFADTTCSTDLTTAMQAEGKGVKISFDDLTNHAVRLTLAKGVAVQGRVVDESGAPLSGIVVNHSELFISPNARDQLRGQRAVTTDAAGKFRLDHVPQKHLFFLVQTAGYAPAVAELDPKAPGSGIELRLAKGTKLAGEIHDSLGNPVGGAHIAFSDFSIWRGVHWEAVADDHGRFQWEDAPAEQFQLQIEKEGFITQRKMVPAGRDTMLSVRLNRTLHVTGTVLDAETREAIHNFRIVWLARSQPRDFADGYPFSTIPGSNGFYSLEVGRLHTEMWSGGYASDCLFRAEADGYAPFVSRLFSAQKGDVGDVTYDVELKRAPQLFGKIVDPGGRPVAGAQVALYTPSCGLFLSGKPRLEGPASGYCVSDDQGGFHLNYIPEASSLVAVQESGFARIGTNELSSNMTVQLQPWGRIEGSLWNYDEAVTNEPVSAMVLRDDSTAWSRSTRFSTNTDDHGRFSFAFVPPGQFAVFGSGMRVTAPVKPGEPAVVKIGGSGRPVVGRFKVTNPYVEIEWGRNPDMYYFGAAEPPRPAEGFKTLEDFWAWLRQPEIEHAFDLSRIYKLQCAKDGSFRIEQVLPGEYQMMVNIYDPREPNAMAFGRYIVKYEGKFQVPTNLPGAREPLDLGDVAISLIPQIIKGETAAPEFEATDMAGKKFTLSDYRGKYVLLDFWATWCAPCLGEIPCLKQAHEKFKDRGDFVMISLSIDQTADAPREFLKKNDLPWVQGYAGGGSGTNVSGQYGIQGIPAIFLVSPEGKIIESDLEGSSLLSLLEKRLK